MPRPLAPDSRCPCLSGDTYADCCGPLHRGDSVAPTATRLMRSRYSAFAVGDAAYLLATWDPSSRPASLTLDHRIRWYRLDIVSSTGGGPLDRVGTVEFEAFYRADAGASSQRENSAFVKKGGRWLYVDAL